MRRRPIQARRASRRPSSKVRLIEVYKPLLKSLFRQQQLRKESHALPHKPKIEPTLKNCQKTAQTHLKI